MRYICRGEGLHGFPELVASLGQDPVPLLEAAGISPVMLKKSNTYLSYIAVVRLLNLAAVQCARPDFGVLLASHQGLEIAGALGNQLCLQETIGNALALLQRHIDFHAQGCLISATNRDHQLILSIDFAFSGLIDCTQLIALSLGLLKRSLSQLSGGEVTPVQVELRQPAPPDTTLYSDVFSAPVKFSQACDQICYPDTLTHQLVAPKAHLKNALQDLWRLDGPERLPLALHLQVERAVTELLPTGDCDLGTVARMVDLHPRVLQKHLKKDHYSFAGILRKTRERLACEYLAHSELSLTDLSFYLGFGDLAVFSRSFKKWTGLSPSEWRAQRRGRQGI
ncbi:AraC family transcriptional regulator [Marinobacter zhejiangensis]|uniref:AraC-type DNA-binding protein n=1 Tax=Marinobacter zhejiangensis TaxID=488535 RepID=A0A1I4P1S2_9GAMM|nr:AraC family transcriptional regulator [Marinobacter zhejiangensis]SFM21490.1 AraC-type DNA-binding protein [Marinobacter zhejiangensis]